jgi:hypothetical protein
VQFPTIDEFDVDGMTVKIELDDHGGHEYPFEHDTAVQFIVFERNSTLSDRHSYSDPADALEAAKAEGLEVFPLFKYEHGNVCYRAAPFSCRWDSGQVGFVFVKREEVGDVEKTVNTSCAILTDWCNGSIYGYIVEDPNGEHLDSCWGFYGCDMEYLKGEATDQAKWHAERYWDAQWAAQAASLEASRPDMYGGDS